MLSSTGSPIFILKSLFKTNNYPVNKIYIFSFEGSFSRKIIVFWGISSKDIYLQSLKNKKIYFIIKNF